MKITFFSNFLNHHQLPFCNEMYKILGKDFKFVATEPIHQERLNMGYSDMSTMYPFTLNTYSDVKSFEKALMLGSESDVVIIGSAPSIFIKNRLKDNKLTFYYAERIFKEGRRKLLNPRLFLSLIKNHTLHKDKNLYMLCASAYTSADFSLVGAYLDKVYKWGYFPEVKEHNIDELIIKKNRKIPKLLWVGRFLDWKHPDDALKAVYLLSKEGYEFTLDIIGSGVMEKQLKSLIAKYELSDRVNILGNMTPEQVREYMESSNIFLFTSDFNEGWGAVLNEAMNSGCAIIASHAIGSVPYLINHRKNGLIYKSGDVNQLTSYVKKLLNNRQLCEEMGKEAYKTLYNTWHPNIAARNLITLSECIMAGEEITIKNGPCSKADRIPNKYKY